MKTCHKCGTEKALEGFSKNSAAPDGYEYRCKQCSAVAKIKYLLSQGKTVNEARFKSAFGGLSAVSKKIFDIVPPTEYFSIPRITTEVHKNGLNVEKRMIASALNDMAKKGLLHEANGFFTRASFKKTNEKPDEAEASKAPEPLAEQPSPAPELPTEHKDPFDGLREIAICLFDISKTVNNLASKIDEQLLDVEKVMQANDRDTKKLKQLHQLIKTIGTGEE